MPAKPTGVQTNRGYAGTDDFITRTHVLPLLVDPESRARLLAEHRANPIGRPGRAGRAVVQHSPELVRVIDKLRRAPMAGKYVRICVVAHRDYRIGVCSGVRGQAVEILPQRYTSEDACEHAIFVRRVRELLAAHGHRIA